MALERKQRKLDHIEFALKTGQQHQTGLEDISFIHQSLPGISLNNVNLTAEVGELELSSPIFINAMTGGGGPETEKLNGDLAIAARETGIAMAVGSQMAAIKDPGQQASFKVVRKENPDGVLIGNLGGEATVEQAKRASEMIGADALQIHINVIQELTMPEGDRDFAGTLSRIEKINKTIGIPVIVKEVGFGMSMETVQQLHSVGVSIIDVGGFGGTNFAKIENERRAKILGYFNEWGIPTAASIVEAVNVSPQLSVIGSGGIQSPLEITKSLALGARGVGLAGHFLKLYKELGLEQLIKEIHYIHEDLKVIMTALGCGNISELRKSKLVIKGNTYHWLSQRGIDCSAYAK
ncbi:isopentenyl pyrophosphate isomerase [Peribacillus simplex]|uniref:Isopentenyl-diphosphate delta-isomerase n=1 Tax=Peribacillus simplex TaxID=1478 RepID=A0AAN2TTS4_9BACI|nr:isopentenyl pyrophosphate isomerase [Peribacillus simplex]